MRKRAFLAAIVLASLAGPALAGNGVDPATIKLRDWEGKRPPSITILGCTPRPDQTGLLNSWLNFNKSGTFLWAGNGPLTEAGAEMMRGNGFVEHQETGSGNRTVTELVLGDAAAVYKEVTEARTNQVSCEVIKEQMFNIPDGVKKGLLLQVRVAVNKRMSRYVNQALTLVFDGNVSDDDLRRIAYEDGVLRAFGFREDY